MGLKPLQGLAYVGGSLVQVYRGKYGSRNQNLHKVSPN